MSPPPSTNGVSSTDTVITPSLEAKIRTLESQHSSLTAQLLTLKSQRTLSHSAPPPPAPSAAPATSSSLLTFALSRNSQLNARSQTRLHRLSSLPTSFRVRDPSTQQLLLGVRIDITAGAKVHKPVYVFYGNDGGVVRHSVPTFLWANGEGGVRGVRARVVRWKRRQVLMERFRESAEGAGRVGDVTEPWWRRVESVEWGLEVRGFVVRWMNRVVAEAVVGERGEVEKCVVRGRRGGRDRAWEAKFKGPVGGLARRLGWEEEEGDGDQMDVDS